MKMLKALGFGIFSAVMFHNTAAHSADAPDFEYHGYMRSGMGFSRDSTDQVCFRAPGTEGASGKFRLGNECETYVETEFAKNFILGKNAADPHFNTHFRFTAVSQGHSDWESTNTYIEAKDADGVTRRDPNGDPYLAQNFTLALREAYVQTTHVFGGDIKPWVGKRFYRRHDIHILDYYTINNSGPGVGVEDVPAVIGNLHLALLRNIPSGTDDGPAQSNFDIRLSDIKIPGAGNLEAILIYGSTGSNGHGIGKNVWESLTGTQIGLIHSMELLGGANKLTAQFGTSLFGGNAATRNSTLSEYGAGATQNIAKGNDAALSARKDSKTTRLVEEFTAPFGKELSTSFVLLYQNVDFGGAKDGNGLKIPNKIETTAGLRPVYSFTDTTALALEYGLTKVDHAIFSNPDYKSSSLQKLTLAPQITAGTAFFARPQLRLFATYATWNEDSKGSTGAPVYGDKTAGFSTGAQFEAWW